jgi:probable rRNA maturation factor
MGIQVEVCVQNAIIEFAPEVAVGTGKLAQPEVTVPPTRITSDQWQNWFQRWLEILQPKFSPIRAYELSLRLTSDREIQTLNAQYRHQDTPTDVLAFASLEIDCPQSVEAQAYLPLYLGDIIISLETADKQATAQGHPLDTELAWLASHGLLHLLGWDHPDDTSLAQMLEQQQVLLHTVGLLVGGS